MTTTSTAAPTIGPSPSPPDWTALITEHLPLADHLAARFRDRGEPMEDLVQVARLGLVLAAQRYDPSSGVPFGGFAVPTVLGELRRHFRDRLWVVRPPRRLQELRPRVVRAQEELAQQLGQIPTVTDIAAHIDELVCDVIEAMCLSTAYVPHALDAEDSTLAETLVAPDHRLAEVDDRLLLRPALSRLPIRNRAVLRLHYFEGFTQREIAGRIGVSQMQVSRILRQSLALVRSTVQVSN